MKNMKILRCNCCGKIIKIKNDMIQEGILEVEWEWGYFSRKDGECHQFCLCESCYDKITENFKIPVRTEE